MADSIDQMWQKAQGLVKIKYKCIESKKKTNQQKKMKTANASNLSLNQNRNQPVNEPWMDNRGRSAAVLQADFQKMTRGMGAADITQASHCKR